MDYNFVSIEEFFALEESGALLESGKFKGEESFLSYHPPELSSPLTCTAKHSLNPAKTPSIVCAISKVYKVVEQLMVRHGN